MNGLYAGGLAFALGWWGLGGLSVEPSQGPSAPRDAIATAPAKLGSSPLAATLGRPVPVALEKPRPLHTSLVSTAPQPRIPQWFVRPSAKKAVFRAQSLDDLPPPLPKEKTISAPKDVQPAQLVVATTEGEAWESEDISLCFETTHLKPFKKEVKAAIPKALKAEAIVTSEAPSKKDEVVTQVKAEDPSGDESAKEMFAEDRSPVTNAKFEVVTHSMEDCVQFASDRAGSSPDTKEKPTLDKEEKGFAADRKSLGDNVVVHAFHHEPEAQDETSGGSEEPLTEGAQDKDKGAPARPANDSKESLDKAPIVAPGPLAQTDIKLTESRLIPNAQVVFQDQNRFYGEADYLVWYTKGDRIPPLVTTGPFASSGILGRPGTTILVGNDRINNDWHSGGRFTVGYWCDPCQELGIEGSYFFLNSRSTHFSPNSDAFPLLARPFFEQNTGQEFSQIATRPDLSTGSVRVDAPTRFWGAELNARERFCCGCNYRVDVLAGFRYLELDEGLDITEDLVALPTVPTFGGDHIIVSDRFGTRNQFYGGQVGVDGEYRFGNWFIDGRAKIALGDNHETLNIGGNQVVTTPAGVTTVFTGGLLALPSNIGHFNRDTFAVAPEVGLKVGYQFSECLRFTVGYDLTYWNRVIRPGGQIDTVLDVNQIPNFGVVAPPVASSRPAVLFKETDFCAQGVSFGVELRY